MEPEIGKPLAKHIYLFTAPLSMWSRSAFQKYMENGVLHDVLEATRSGRSGTIDFYRHRMVNIAKKPGDVSFPQGKRFLGLIPEEKCGPFFTAFTLWSQTSGWWEENTPTWEDRDEWREEMGLERNHPIRVVSNFQHDKIKIVFLRTGHCSIPQICEPGFRYARIDEIGQVMDLPKGLSIVAWIRGRFVELEQFGEDGPLIPKEHYTPDFHNYVYFVPVVKEE